MYIHIHAHKHVKPLNHPNMQHIKLKHAGKHLNQAHITFSYTGISQIGSETAREVRKALTSRHGSWAFPSGRLWISNLKLSCWGISLWNSRVHWS